MNSKDIIKINNEMREKLTEENLAIYEDMLVYIRLNGNKSEQQTEEVLFELLEHLLHAQEEGKTAKAVFGNDLKKYCDELIAEIPSEKRSASILFGVYIAIDFLAFLSLIYGILSFGAYHFFNFGSNEFTFALGSAITIILIYLLLLYIFIVLVFKWIKKSLFKDEKPKKWVEFFKLWVICTLCIGLLVLIPFIFPSFGMEISIPVLSFAVVGVVLYTVKFILNKKYKITK
ncbi:DUF1129 family protein [Ornithinibacillus sp. JPR2-1]|uniref:DUF1129 family protein n=1 Tax=Ornithinibacillus sp. JPR2-1 TaxID=2094019 RepID=UPI0031D42A45